MTVKGADPVLYDNDNEVPMPQPGFGTFVMSTVQKFAVEL